MKARKAHGFTLVEILIVVVILGILAAIVIPQFTSASESARASSMVSQLQTIRSQLELGQIQHQGTYPNLVANQWTPMTGKTEPVSAYTAGDDPDADNNNVGPYLQQAPVNPFTGTATVAADNSGGWKYDSATGQMQAVVPADKATSLGLSATDYVAGP